MFNLIEQSGRVSQESENTLKAYYPSASDAGKAPRTVEPSCQPTRQEMLLGRKRKATKMADLRKWLDERLTGQRNLLDERIAAQRNQTLIVQGNRISKPAVNLDTPRKLTLERLNPTEVEPQTYQRSSEGQWQLFSVMRPERLSRQPLRHPVKGAVREMPFQTLQPGRDDVLGGHVTAHYYFAHTEPGHL